MIYFIERWKKYYLSIDLIHFGCCWCTVSYCRRNSIRMVNPPGTFVWFGKCIFEFLQGGWLHEKGIGIGGKRRKWGDLSWSENPIWFLYQYITWAFYAEGVRSPYTPPSRRIFAAALFKIKSFCNFYAKFDSFNLTRRSITLIMTMSFWRNLAKWRFFICF